MQEALKQYGLSANEIALYASGIKVGEGTANRLAEVSGITRSTVYDVLESLRAKGLVYSLEKDKKLHFVFKEPKVLREILREKIQAIDDVLPELSALFKTVAEKPRVELYEGLTSMKQAFNELLDYDELLAYGAGVRADEILGPYTANYSRRRAERGVMLKAIVEEEVPKHMLEKEVKKCTQVKRLPVFKDHRCTYFIYGNKVLALLLGEEKFVVKITSPILAQSQRIVFNYLWKLAK